MKHRTIYNLPLMILHQPNSIGKRGESSLPSNPKYYISFIDATHVDIFQKY